MTSRRLTYQVTIDTDGHRPDIDKLRDSISGAAIATDVVVMLVGDVSEGDEDVDEVARLERAYRNSFEQAAALAYVRAMILRDFPTATLLRTSDSDQSAGYVFQSIEDAAGNTLCSDEADMDVDLWAPLSDLRARYLHDAGIDPYAITLTTQETSP